MVSSSNIAPVLRTGFPPKHPLHGSVLELIYGYDNISRDSMEKNKKISASALSAFLGCELKYQFSHIDKIEAPMDSPHLIYGSALHKAIEDMHKSIYYEKLISKRQMAIIFRDNWQLGIELNEVPVRWGWKNTEKAMTQAGLRSVDFYYDKHKNDKPPPTYLDFKNNRVPAIEIRFRVSLDDLVPGCGYDLSGIIDRIDHQENLNIEDHKTGSAKYTPFQIATNLQLCIYSYAFRQLVKMGKFPAYTKDTVEDRVVFDIISKKKPEIYYHKRKIGPSSYKHLGIILQRMIRRIGDGEFLPAYGAQCDSFGGCEFKEHCMDYQFS